MKEQKPLVSILTPCYNSEQYIGRMLDSILGQTYPNIEVVCIDDGSTDKTVDIIKSYIEQFERQRKSLIYISSEHKGQAAAINKGLKIIKGEYFGCLDSDDFLTKNSIERRVEFLEEYQEFSVVVSDYYIVNETDLSIILGRGNKYVEKYCYQPKQFCLTIAGYSLISSLGYIIRTKDMRKINSSMDINECKEGQNYQILLPIYYYYKRGYINEPLGYYVIRDESHSHILRSEEQERERNLRLLIMLEEVLTSLGLPLHEIQRYKKISVFNKYLEEN